MQGQPSSRPFRPVAARDLNASQTFRCSTTRDDRRRETSAAYRSEAWTGPAVSDRPHARPLQAVVADPTVSARGTGVRSEVILDPRRIGLSGREVGAVLGRLPASDLISHRHDEPALEPSICVEPRRRGSVLAARSRCPIMCVPDLRPARTRARAFGLPEDDRLTELQPTAPTSLGAVPGRFPMAIGPTTRGSWRGRARRERSCEFEACARRCSHRSSWPTKICHRFVYLLSAVGGTATSTIAARLSPVSARNTLRSSALSSRAQ
jgi:hypothetical protein